ncbi:MULTISPECIES: RIP metalloprotease RseP [Sporomusa]|uniref:Zinc metalloprotease n=2 Tax=Sporomusa TaxID=2375 RepID=A0ABP2BZU6_9FIRM|nr:MULTISPECIES: RIP metalloprotease RseP [Sporomusa]MCM0760154.1 RIP metalloprotease RseP [Sporomusa sphaeroides DSM 2875]OLS58197.1 regulator of sigma-W protease RasP [Sporomusa sphaeroides DSM 2875]CVK17616.1 Regulator of sigma-W protease RasP [Sporomusa sphaeroides DSM 2875]SCM80423.1 putative zinc metalloprotease [uncultured Sporomusa sp.]HML31530.1 RIP metalloprotease RseP [Sporomusa sphaeroides]
MSTVIATIFVFGLLILVHELGHFITAKSVGMRVDEFAIGFGPKLISKKIGETIYSLRIIPLGGYNKIAGMDPDEEQDERSFSAKPIWARMLVIVAGSAMNLVLPVVLLFIVFVSAGIDTPSNQPIIGKIFPDKPAAMAGLLPGDKVSAVNGTPIESWRDFVSVIQSHAGANLTITYARGSEQDKTAILTPEYDESTKRGIIGVMPLINKYQPGVVEAIGLAGKQTLFVAQSMVVGIAEMITGKAAADVAGPIGVAQMAGEVAQLGIIPLLQFAAFLSINLGLINLLPVPVLDGGHVVTLAVEGLRGKPLNRNQMQFIQMIGFALLMLLFVVATFKDISRLKLF